MRGPREQSYKMRMHTASQQPTMGVVTGNSTNKCFEEYDSYKGVYTRIEKYSIKN